MPGARLHTHARTCSGSPVHPETSSGSSIVATEQKGGDEGGKQAAENAHREYVATDTVALAKLFAGLVVFLGEYVPVSGMNFPQA